MSSLKFLVWVLAPAILVGCQVDSTVLISTTPETSPQTQSIHNPDPSPTESHGRLAYIGGDGNVYVTTANRETTIAITDDATTFPEKEGFSYHRLAWSPKGSLAFAAVTRENENFSSQLYVVDSPGEVARIVGQSDEQAVIYIYWSPTACSSGPGCQRLAYLIEEDNSIALHIVEMKAGRVENRVAGLAQPFYFAWSPDSHQMLWHTGGARRHNEEGRLTLYDVDTDQWQTLPYTTGLFFAPVWSPQGDSWLGVSADEAIDQLQIFGHNEQPTTLTTNPDGQIVFLWSPQGDQIAYAKREGVDPVFGPIHIFDLETRQTKRITAPRFSITAFFWSPDGQRIAYLPKLIPDANRLQWRIYDLERDEDRGFTAFTPSFQMWFMVSSFNQYAQSHSFWSPDSRYLVYADRDTSRIERVWLIDTWADGTNEPILIDEGSIGVWSWN